MFDTAKEKDEAYKTTKNHQLEEILCLLQTNDELLHYTLLHKLNSKLKHLHLLRKMGFGALLILVFGPILWLAVALYMIIKPGDTMDITYGDSQIDHIKFNTGAIVFAN